MRVLLDTNVVLDLLLDRDGFVEDATVIWEANARGEIEAFIAAITPINVFFITCKSKGLDAARRHVEQLLASLQVCPLNHQALLAAEILPLKDYPYLVKIVKVVKLRHDKTQKTAASTE